ncbi:hypothetical protein PQR46_32325 [Paraburkholderia sediminicola]|uniref:hypothetical protein n=1 Tax=Paraburkholderia sediminicola TaxID=458836 RepID=UPI0038BCA7E1
MSELPSYFSSTSKLANAWNRPLSDSASFPATIFAREEAERHTIYSLLLMTIVHGYWNGNKDGARDCDYPPRPKQKRADGTYMGDSLGDRYLGHNIAALAVDASGRVVDFDFNHNKIFNSSVQHAEARLIRRLFGLAAVEDSWDLTTGPREYRTDLKETTVYTSLESCAQCAGIMALANLPRVVYLQPDPGQYMIGQLLRNLSDVPTAEHIPASSFGFSYFKQLTEGFAAFQGGIQAGQVFWRSNDVPPKIDATKAVTSFLCTDHAWDTYASATADFGTFVCQFPSHAPVNSVRATAAMTNDEVLSHCREFATYAISNAQRGTPHYG